MDRPDGGSGSAKTGWVNSASEPRLFLRRIPLALPLNHLASFRSDPGDTVAAYGLHKIFIIDGVKVKFDKIFRSFGKFVLLGYMIVVGMPAKPDLGPELSSAIFQTGRCTQSTFRT